jgi:YVTN family beta-propeller protein
VIDGATNQVLATVPAGYYACAPCWAPNVNRVYCANEGSNDLTVIDGETNLVVDTIHVGDAPRALLYCSSSNRLYCVNWAGGDVSVIDVANDSVYRTIPVGPWPVALCRNPSRDRIYVANSVNSSVSVLRDSGVTSIADGSTNDVTRPGPTVLRGGLRLAQASGCELIDACGRRVLKLHPGENDVSRVAPGVYFVQEQPRLKRQAQAVRKIVIQH